MHSEWVCGRLIIARIAASSAGGAPGTSIEVNWTVVSHMPGWSETALGEQANNSAVEGASSISLFIKSSLSASATPMSK
jgi:hypothetical protein